MRPKDTVWASDLASHLLCKTALAILHLELLQPLDVRAQKTHMLPSDSVWRALTMACRFAIDGYLPLTGM